MEPFLYYLLRASVLIVLFYGLYRFFFANNTFHNVNRFSLITLLLVISLLPLFRFNLIPEKETERVGETFLMDFSTIPVTEYAATVPKAEIPWIQILMVLFAVGFLFTLIRYLIGLGQIITIIHKSEKQVMDDHTVLCITDRTISPFSWMKYIVLSRKEVSGDHQAVIRHEKAHIRLRHSFDMILFDIFTCLFWFNPFSWLLRREIQSVHEYQADQQVLDHGVDSIQYQILLIRKSVGEYKFALANNFRQRDLHKRITMMKKTKTDKRLKWNYAMVLPMLFLAMIALSVPTLNAKTVEKERTELNEVSDNHPGVLVSGILKDQQGVIVGGLVTIKGTNRGTVTDINGNFQIRADIGSTLQFSMIQYKTTEYYVEKEMNNLEILLERDDVKSTDNEFIVIGAGQMENARAVKEKVAIRTVGGNQPLYIVDGKTISEDEIQKINPEAIESISVLKDKSAIDIYGEKGKDGVILIETKKKNKADDIVVTGYGSMDSLKGDVKNMVRVRRYSTKNSDSVYITSSSLVQDTLKYSSLGEFVSDGLVLGVKNPDNSVPLIIVDGEKMPKDFDLNSITPNEIESVSVLKYKSATDTYGDEGKNGVVIITKKPL